MLATSFFDPVPLATFVVAAVTLGLVIVTWRQSGTARRALELSTRPLLADPAPVVRERDEYLQFGAPYRRSVNVQENAFYLYDADGKFEVSVPFRNIGAGSAVITDATIEPGAPGDVLYSRKFVPPGEHVRVNISILLVTDDARDLLDAWSDGFGAFSVTIAYTDAEGGQKLLSRADIRGYATHGPFVERIAITRQGDAEPFAISGPSHGHGPY
jgi:hypothetical protein